MRSQSRIVRVGAVPVGLVVALSLATAPASGAGAVDDVSGGRRAVTVVPAAATVTSDGGRRARGWTPIFRFARVRVKACWKPLEMYYYRWKVRYVNRAGRRRRAVARFGTTGRGYFSQPLRQRIPAHSTRIAAWNAAFKPGVATTKDKVIKPNGVSSGWIHWEWENVRRCPAG